MTALNVDTQVPNAINSAEKLAVWLGTALAKMNPTQEALVNPNQSQYKASYTVFKGADGRWYVSLNQIIELEANWEASTDPFWNAALDISNTAFPVGFVNP